MFSISFFYKVFVITTIKFMVSGSRSVIYQMVKKNVTFATYMSNIVPLKTYEKKMNINEFYDTLHNLKYKGIPEGYEKYDYEAYQNEILNYCKLDYVSIEYFERQYQIELFTRIISDLNVCLSTILTDEQKKIMIKSLEFEPYRDDEVNELMFLLKRHNTVKCFPLTEENAPCFAKCLSLDFNKEKISKLFAEILLKDIEKKGLSKNGNFQTCIQTFRDNLYNILEVNKEKSKNKKGGNQCPVTKILLKKLEQQITQSKNKKAQKKNKRDPNLNELFLVLGILYYSSKLDNVDMGLLLQNHAKINEIKKEPKHEEYCKEKIDIMDKVTYTATKLSYMILPDISEHKTLEFYKERRNKIIDNLSAIDENNSEFYKELKNYTEKITENYLKSFIKRRAMNNEDYYLYAMRMSIRGYLPLSLSLWNEEKANAVDKQENTEKEFTEDLKEIEN